MMQPQNEVWNWNNFSFETKYILNQIPSLYPQAFFKFITRNESFLRHSTHYTMLTTCLIKHETDVNKWTEKWEKAGK